MLNQEQVLNFCNKVRKAGGADTLDALLPGIPVESRSCLITRNLNFDCKIAPVGLNSSDLNNWMMQISSNDGSHKEIAEKISSELDMPIINRNYSGAIDLKLPVELAEVAYNFDRVWERLKILEEQVELEADLRGDVEKKRQDVEDFKNNLEHPWLLELVGM